MTRLVVVGIVLLGLAAPSLAARVYLKDGGMIDAKSVWRSKGKIHVLVNRDTLTEFSRDEVDMKRTFVKRHRVQKKGSVAPLGEAKTALPGNSAASQKPADKKSGLSLPSLPKLPQAKPESLTTGGDEGAIRKHKREMLERTNE